MPPLLRLLISATLIVTAGAPAAQALSISPPRTVHQTKPGKALTGFFTVTNDTDTPLKVKVEPEDWAQGLTGKRGAVPWLTVKPAKLMLRPGKEARVKYTIRVPKDASGELRAQVFFTSESTERSVSMRSRLGAIIYVGVEGTERIDAEITTLEAFYTASTPGVAKPDRMDVVLGIQNRSNVHIIPGGRIRFRDAKDVVVETVTLQEGWGLLPNEEDRYHAIQHGVHLKPGTYSIDIAVECGNDLRHPKTITKTVRAEVSPQGTVRVLEDVPASAP